jgi:hypothetical protein
MVALGLVAALGTIGSGVAASAAERHHKKHEQHALHPRPGGRQNQQGQRPRASTMTRTPSAAASAAPSAATGAVCGGMTNVKSVNVSHVIWIVLENRSYNQVMGAPYISSLAARCGVATNYHNISHPSLPNYIAMTSGRAMGQLPRTDCGGSVCAVPGPSIFTQTSSWRVFAESMPGPCVRHDAPPYVVHHTAAPFYTAVRNCSANDLPLTALNLAALPRFTLIVPDVRHDMHENTSSVSAGDRWLRAHLGAILASRAYRTGSTVVFVTWDEGGMPRHTRICATNTTDQGCHVALLVMSPYLRPGTRWTGLANHYSLLQATEHLLGLPYLGLGASAPSIRAAFRV